MTSLADIAQSLREAEIVRLSVLSAYKAGDVVFVECTRPISDATLKSVRDSVEKILADTGIRIVVLGDALRVVAREAHTTLAPGASSEPGCGECDTTEHCRRRYGICDRALVDRTVLGHDSNDRAATP